jgi:hypothetical protein
LAVFDAIGRLEFRVGLGVKTERNGNAGEPPVYLLTVFSKKESTHDFVESLGREIGAGRVLRG